MDCPAKAGALQYAGCAGPDVIVSGEAKMAWIAMGSNLGDSLQTLQRAFLRLQDLSTAPVRQSSFWQTTPVDCPPGSPPFLNAVIEIQPLQRETPESLLEKLQCLEREFGRLPKKILNEARPLDLDLIAFSGEIRQTQQLVLPHPCAHERRFVLQPLSEIAPNLILPGQSETVTELLQTLPPDAQMKLVR
jgi:2-amino-4-hydroxy-6-hydroxymethyldihydropteridine diphosphokinase